VKSAGSRIGPIKETVQGHEEKKTHSQSGLEEMEKWRVVEKRNKARGTSWGEGFRDEA